MNFDRIAPLYSLLEKLAFGERLHQARTVFIDQVRQAEQILLVGEGRGRLLQEILRINPSAVVTVVEHSKRMIKHMQKLKFSHSESRIFYICSSFWDFESNKKFDIVYTCFFWDCFEKGEIKTGLKKTSKLLSKSGIWVNVDFASPQAGSFFLNLYHKVLLNFLYGFFQVSCGLKVNKIITVSPLAEAEGLKRIEGRKFVSLPLMSEIFSLSRS